MKNILLDNNIIIDFLSEDRLKKYNSSRQLYELFSNTTNGLYPFLYKAD